MKELLSSVLLILLSLESSLYGLRNPFIPAPGHHCYVCSAIGIIHETTQRFALIAIDGVCHQVCQDCVIAGHTVVGITDGIVLLCDEHGKVHQVFLQ